MTEREYIEAIIQDPLDAKVRDDYAKFLEERGEFARAEYLRLTLQGRQEERLKELAVDLPPTWLAVVANPVVEGCGKSRGEGMIKWRLSFKVLCDRTWAQLRTTDNDGVRFCDECKENVYYCTNLADARTHARHQHCIAVDMGLPRKPGDSMSTDIAVFGNPSEDHLREVDETELDHVSEARLKKERAQPKEKRSVDAPWEAEE